MNDLTETALFLGVGVLVVAVAVLTLSPVGERTMTSELVDRGPPPADHSVTAYSDLSQPAREAVDEVLREEETTFSSYEDHAKLEALPRTLHVEKGGEVYHVRTTSADGSGGLFEGLVHDTLLAIAGLLFGSAAYVSVRKRRFAILGAFPFASTAVVLGVNALRAPDVSSLAWIVQTSFGFAVAAPVLIGIAARRRDLRIVGLAGLTLLASVGVLHLGDEVSALGVLIGTALLAIPGTGFGWWLGNDSKCVTATGSAGPD